MSEPSRDTRRPGLGRRPARDRVTIMHTLQRWLPLSEGFVHAVVTGSRHRSVVVSRQRPENRRAFPHTPVFSLGWLFPLPRHPSSTERRAVTLALIAIAVTQRARLVHHHHGYRLQDVSGLVRRLRLPLVVSLHGQDVTTHAVRWPGDMVDTLPYASAVVVPSRFLGSRLGALGVPAERIHVIPAGVDVDFFSPAPLPNGKPEVLFVGRFVEKKGIDVLLDAWPRVRRTVPGATLRLVGNGPLEALARSGGADVIVEPTDPSRRAHQVRDAIHRANLVVTPSRTAADGDAETLLLVNLEAQASGRPLVTTRHGGIPEYVREGETAMLVPEADPEALAVAMTDVLTSRSLAERLASAGPAFAERFRVEACTAMIDDLYDSLIR